MKHEFKKHSGYIRDLKKGSIMTATYYFHLILESGEGITFRINTDLGISYIKKYPKNTILYRANVGVYE